MAGTSSRVSSIYYLAGDGAADAGSPVFEVLYRWELEWNCVGGGRVLYVLSGGHNRRFGSSVLVSTRFEVQLGEVGASVCWGVGCNPGFEAFAFGRKLGAR